MGRILGVLYGIVAYAAFLVAFLYAIGFVGGLVVPKHIDSGVAPGMAEALIVNLLLLSAFAVQHSVMARPWFKAAWTRIVPASVERSTYVLLSSLVLLLLYWQWRPMPSVMWNVADANGRMAIQGLFWLGWVIVLLSTFMINHFDLFGLRQVYFLWRGEASPQLPFVTRGFYRFVRHPIMVGFIIAFWAAPTMTLGHLVFAATTTAYILVALQFEEHDLMEMLGDAYRDYKKRVPMLIPWR